MTFPKQMLYSVYISIEVSQRRNTKYKMKAINKAKKLLAFVLTGALLLPDLTVMAAIASPTDGYTMSPAPTFDLRMDLYGCVYSDGSWTGNAQEKMAVYKEPNPSKWEGGGFTIYIPGIEDAYIEDAANVTVEEKKITLLPFPKNAQSTAISTVSADFPMEEPSVEEPSAEEPSADEPSVEEPSAVSVVPEASGEGFVTASVSDNDVLPSPGATGDHSGDDDRETDIPEPVIAEPDNTQTYGNMTRDAVAASAAAPYPEYPEGNLDFIEGEYYGKAKSYPDKEALSYREFMNYLSHYAQFKTYYVGYCGGNKEKEYAKYAEYATYLLIKSFAREFNLFTLESACERMLEKIPASDGPVDFTLDSDELNNLCSELDYYNSHIMENFTAKKAGYSLTAFRVCSSLPCYDSWTLSTDVAYNRSEGDWYYPTFSIGYLPIAPVFQPVNTWYGKVSELEEEFKNKPDDLYLRAGSLVYSECSKEGSGSKDRSARFFIKTKYNKDNDTAHFIDELAYIYEGKFNFEERYNYYKLLSDNSTGITRVPSQYKPEPDAAPVNVTCWKVVNIIYPKTDQFQRHPFYDEYDWYWHGDAYKDIDNLDASTPVEIAKINFGQYDQQNNVMIELEPCDEPLIDVPTPNISLEDISLKLEKGGDPTSHNSAISGLTEDNYYLSYYAEPISTFGAGRAVDDSSTELWKTYSGGWSKAERLLYPGDWHVKCRAVYKDDGGTSYYSKTAAQDIHITEPLLMSPEVTISGTTAAYAAPDSISAKVSDESDGTLSNSADSYNSYLSSQQLIRKTTQDPDATPESLSLPNGSLDEAADFSVQDSLAAGYNKIFAYTVLTLPDSSKIVSVPGKAARSYYSDLKDAVKEPEQAYVSFDTQGGRFNPNGTGYQEADNQVPVGSAYGVNGRLPMASKEHYSFDGWYTQAADGEQVTAQTTVNAAGPQTLYAHYTEDTYTISFDANGGTGSMEPMADIPYTSTQTLRTNTFTKSDGQRAFTFAGWSIARADDNEISTVRWQDCATVTGTDFRDGEISWDAAGSKGTVILYAVWRRETPDPPTPPTPPDPPVPPNPPTPPSEQEVQISLNALSNPVQTVQRVIENVKTGDSRPYWKWCFLLVIGILTTLYPIFAILYSHFRQKERKSD